MTLRNVLQEMVILLREEGQSPHTVDGQRRIRHARQAIAYVNERLDAHDVITLEHVKQLGCLLEPVTNFDWRLTRHDDMLPPPLVKAATRQWVAAFGRGATDIDRAIRIFMTISPFFLGNARVALLLRFWLQAIQSYEAAGGSRTDPKTES